jgi:hypothetical protein
MPPLMGCEEILVLRLKTVSCESVAWMETNSSAERRDRPFDSIHGSEYYYDLNGFKISLLMYRACARCLI